MTISEEEQKRCDKMQWHLDLDYWLRIERWLSANVPFGLGWIIKKYIRKYAADDNLHWTLVSEKCPETTYGTFDVTVRNWSDRFSVWELKYALCVDGTYRWKVDGGWDASKDMDVTDRVIAWRAKPRPYEVEK